MYDGPVFITFYALTVNNEWRRVQTPIRIDDVGSQYQLALYGTKTFVGFENGIVLVYEQNLFGEWERVEEKRRLLCIYTSTLRKLLKARCNTT